jgi:hypothetical protein
VYVCVCIYIYIEREREREREGYIFLIRFLRYAVTSPVHSHDTVSQYAVNVRNEYPPLNQHLHTQYIKRNNQLITTRYFCGHPPLSGSIHTDTIPYDIEHDSHTLCISAPPVIHTRYKTEHNNYILDMLLNISITQTNEGHLESKERSRIQPAHLFQCS